jgi:uncharacterized repeat protein (TIGR04076 family)
MNYMNFRSWVAHNLSETESRGTHERCQQLWDSLSPIIFKLETENDKLKDQIKSMRCCDNCIYGQTQDEPTSCERPATRIEDCKLFFWELR